MGMIPSSFERGTNADGTINRTIGGFGALLGCILQAQFNRVHADFVGHHVHGAFHRKCSDGGRRRTIGRTFRTIEHHVFRHRFHILEIIAGPGRHGPKFSPGERKCAVLIAQLGKGRRNRTIILRTNFDIDGR